MKKFAFILMGQHYDPSLHQAHFQTENQISSIFTVQDFEQAKEKVQKLWEEGYGAIEICGAFGKEKAEELTELTKHQVAIGYVVHNPELDELFAKFFGDFSK